MIKLAAILKDGKIYTGRRHDIILSEAETKHGLGFGGLRNGQQGFITEDNVFVDRAEAARIAFASGQILEPLKKLYSENLDFLMIRPKQSPEIEKIMATLSGLEKKAEKAQHNYELDNISYHYELGLRVGLNYGLLLLQENVPENRFWIVGVIKTRVSSIKEFLCMTREAIRELTASAPVKEDSENQTS